MTKPPYTGQSPGPSVPSTDFGATTVSGTPSTRRTDAGPPPAAPPRPAAPPPTSARPNAAPPNTARPSPPPPPTSRPNSAAPPPPVRPSTPPATTARPNTTSPTTARPNAGSPTTVSPRPATPPPGAPSPVGPPPAGPKPPAGPLPTPGGATTPGQQLPGPGAPAKANRADRMRGPRRARLQLRHINPWTVLKFSCVLSIALFFVWLIVIGVLFGILDAAGVVGKINDSVTLINGSGSKAPVTAGVVFGGAAIIGVVNIVLFIALSTIGSVVYNLCADLVGGIELTLSES
jgi:hypothetical protein